MNKQDYWLKVQKAGVSKAHELSLENEIRIYEQISAFDLNVLAPYELVNVHEQCGLDQSYLMQGLLIADGEALFSRDPNTLVSGETVKILLSSLGVLERLHQMSFLHGDLKTEHFRVFENKTVLIDLEQAYTFLKQATQKNTATPRYMAPELFHAAEKSIASDMYALGIIWLQWLNQEKLQAKTYLEWARLHCQDLKIELPVQFLKFEAVLDVMLVKEKKNRCTNFYQIKQLLSENV